MLSVFNISTLHSLSCRLSTCTDWLCSKTTCTPPTQTTLTCSPKPVWSGWTASTAQTTKWWPGWTREERCMSTTRDASPQVGSTQHVHKHAQHTHVDIVFTLLVLLLLCPFSSTKPCMWGGPVWEGWRLLWYLSARKWSQDTNLPLSLWIQPGQWWQVLQK